MNKNQTEQTDFREAAQKLFSERDVKATVTLISDGKGSTGLVAGTGEDIVKMLATVMIEQKDVRKLFELAYMQVAAYSVKE